MIKQDPEKELTEQHAANNEKLDYLNDQIKRNNIKYEARKAIVNDPNTLKLVDEDSTKLVVQ